ncbi:hypothetical protein QUF72_10975 [Desulfobacterales bacterium HSG2]|nr:hypothetical protein [Desulfobacterales bacterium HSG2]
MCKKIFLTVFIPILSMLLMFSDGRAQITIELVSDPDIKRISVGSNPKEIRITARANKENLKFSWNIEGPGSLSGDTPTSEIFYYVPPDYINEEAERVIITAVATDDKGETATSQIRFTLVKPASPTGSIRVSVDVPDVTVYVNEEIEGTAYPDQPADFPSVPTGQAIVRVKADGYQGRARPVQVSPGQLSEITFRLNPQGERVEELLKEGNAFFEQRQFTTPKGKNAFDRYKKVLELNPENRHARKKIPEILKSCKRQGDNAFDQKNHTEAGTFYRECLPVAQYALNLSGNREIETDIRIMQDRLKELKVEQPPADNLLKKADVYFDQQQFTTPKGKNAFDAYKQILQTEPENAHARERIYEMMKIYQAWGNYADRQKDYGRAKRFYRRYLSIANYVLNTLGDQDTSRDIRKTRRRLKSLENIVRSADRLLKLGDMYFDQEQFASLIEKNALDIYKDVLKKDPGNYHAREKIREMTDICKTRGDGADKRADYQEAKSFYRQYLLIADYASDIPGIQPDELEVWKIQNRVKELETLVAAENLKPLERKLSVDLRKYTKLREKENQGVDITGQIVRVLRDIIRDLDEIEGLYKQFTLKNSVILKKLERIRNTRRELKNEMSARTNK